VPKRERERENHRHSTKDSRLILASASREAAETAHDFVGQLAKKQSGNGPLSLSLPLRNPGHFLKIGNQEPQNLSRHFLNNYLGLLT
jgi:hypothetical protein